MSRRVAYLGDDYRPGPASYLAGILTHFRIPFEHVPSDKTPPASVFSDDVGLYVLSDYPSAQFTPETMGHLVNRLRAGAGLLMLGGWGSYHGLDGNYDKTPLAEILPVKISHEDDRRNVSQLCLVREAMTHPILNALPMQTPPGIGGYNAFTPKPGSHVVLEGELFHINATGGAEPVFTTQRRIPLLVVGQGSSGGAGAGRRACLATDVAPHWIGGFVDWGPEERLTVQMNDSEFIEVGRWYAEFFRNLVTWTLGTPE